MDWPLWVCGAEAGDEVVFVCLDCTLDEVAAMVSLWCGLEIYAFFVHEVYEEFGAFVVEALELWTKSAEDESIVDGHICCEDGWCLAIFDGGTEDDVAVKVIQEEKVVHAAAGGDKEATGLV